MLPKCAECQISENYCRKTGFLHYLCNRNSQSDNYIASNMDFLDSKKAYKAPQAKVIEVGIMSILCGSQGGACNLGSSSTEQLIEQDVSGSIW